LVRKPFLPPRHQQILHFLSTRFAAILERERYRTGTNLRNLKIYYRYNMSCFFSKLDFMSENSKLALSGHFFFLKQVILDIVKIENFMQISKILTRLCDEMLPKTGGKLGLGKIFALKPFFSTLRGFSHSTFIHFY
jgi:hypothetical protein